ncbi:MAG: glycosyl hydrolase family 8 [Phototrophicaceae bacterium]
MVRVQILLIFFLLIFSSVGQAQMSQSQLIVDYNQSDIDRLWDNWQRNYIEPIIISGRNSVRVIADAQTQATFSEGQSYGMLFSVLMNDQSVFDQLWIYATSYFNRNGLMSWHIGQDRQRIDEGAATDADLDMAMALVYACRRVQEGDWQVTFDYCVAARDMINAIWTHEVDKSGDEPAAGLSNNQGYELIPGDLWCLSCDYPAGITNLSYFAPAYFEIFAELTSNTEWQDAINRNYDLLETAQLADCSGLVPNWTTYDGQAQIVEWQGETSAYWGWDAARVSWRLALSRYWFNDVRANTALNEIGGFFDGIGLSNVRSEYRLDGTPVNGYTDTFFIAHAANAIWGMTEPARSSCRQVGAPNNTSRQQAYNAVLRQSSDGYYNDSWQLLSAMLMAGYFNHPAESFKLPQQIAVVVPTLTPLPTNTPQVEVTSTNTVVAPTPMPIHVTSEIAGVSVEQRITLNNNQQIQFQMRIINESPQTLDSLAIRFYFQVDADKVGDDYVFEIYWDSTDSAVVNAPRQHDNQIYYTEISYPLTLASNSNWELHGALHLEDWSSTLDTSNHWWLQDLSDDNFIETPYLPLFMNNNLIFGSIP